MAIETTRRSGDVAVTLNDVERSYARWARLYDLMFGFVLEDGRRKLVHEIERAKPRSLLEMGVGTGLLLPHYRGVERVVGIDICDEMLSRATRRVRYDDLQNVCLQRADCEQTHFHDGEFDCVVLPYVLSVTPDPYRLLAEASRVCASDGHVVLVNHFSGSHAWRVLERVAAPFAARIGFRSDFSYENHVGEVLENVLRQTPANIFGLSRVVVAKPGVVGRTSTPASEDGA